LLLAAAPAAEAIVKTVEEGPVKATVEVRPAKPRLGDRLELTLVVEARPGVELEMPPFGEALGRFAIAEFVPRSERRADGGAVERQRYLLEAPMSGRQRLPSLRIAWRALGDAGAAEVHELLTEELSVEVASLLPDDKRGASLRPLRGVLPERGTRRNQVLLGLAGILLIGAGAFVGAKALRRRTAEKLRRSAFEVAMDRLAALEASGLPDGERADPWYVELSGIVRSYLEDRFAIRAPELTTEEFLREAGRSLEVSGQRELLGRFLERCDRVKFAAYRPGDAESREAIASARRFLEETRLAEARP
jgi:hypothetical protein